MSTLKQKTTRLLHGTLDVTIYETRKLRFRVTGSDLQSMTSEITAPIKTKTKRLTRRLTSHFKRLVLSQPQIVDLSIYATVDLDKARVGRTKRVRIQNKSSNPKWEEQFHIYCAHEASHITFTIKDNKPVGAILIGRAHVPVEDVLQTHGSIFDGWVNIVDEDFVPIRGNPQIRVKLQFKDVAQDVNWSRGIANPSYNGVPNTPFPQRRGCRVTLYQDAHVGDDFNPTVSVRGNRYKPHRCWEDIYEAISNAKHIVYVAGWSVNVKITLKREVGKTGYNVKLGDLLKRKADEGVNVLVLVWDDRTSVQVKELKRDGLMDTHDQETATFFANTNVHCVLCPRVPDEENSMVQELTGSTMFTHHQKMVIVDAESVEFKDRRIVSFIGGIDLCDGRYDTQDHPLFKTLNTIHNQDFHQPNFEGASIAKGGPREPWHDIHCRLEGSIAWDVLYNFEDRWTKQVGDRFIVLHDKFREIPIVESPANPNPNDPDTWNVQLFRSIDEGAVEFKFPLNIKGDLVGHGLITGKDCIIERSIQDAYIHAIRRAKSFIYIENQYFLGSSFGWKSKDVVDSDIGALHLIPKELSLKIVSKIEAGERFTVYVVIPMWPEGVPESESVQAILDWQRRTMEMMYKDIAEAIKKKGLNTKPRDYLTFYCLGNREWKKNANEHVPTETVEPGSDYYRAQQERRFMIYVHSKMMIVDDEYIIIGSANINQRSMDGARDTEIAMGAFQPNHLSSSSSRGHIYGFRMSLWYEHLGYIEANGVFDNPEKLECVRKVNERADYNWKLYTTRSNYLGQGGGECPTHLLRYPIDVNSNGSLTALLGFEHFPDTKAPVLGTKAAYLPPILTT